jgi:uncharacterized protein involved in outer membrane biogenesis
MTLTSQEAARNEIAAQLIELEAGLRQLGLWSGDVALTGILGIGPTLCCRCA